MFVVIVTSQVDATDKFMLCEQQWVVYTLGDSFKK